MIPETAAAEPPAPVGVTRFVPENERMDALTSASSEHFLDVDLPAPGPEQRGYLAEWLEGAVETALLARGGDGAGVDAATGLDTSLSDQLYRARDVGARGVCVWVPPLTGIANLAGALDAQDSAVLRWWIRATGERPVRLYIDERNRHLTVYDTPVHLEVLLSDPPASERRPRPARSPRPAPLRLMRQLDLDLARLVAEEAEAEAEAEAEENNESQAPDEQPGNAPPESALTIPVEPAALALAPPEAETAAPASDASEAASDLEPSPVSTSTPTDGPREVTARKEWRHWLAELERARGPKSLAAVERMFVSNYVPLREAVTQGIADASAERVLSTWAESFATSYLEAFAALCLRGKRPTMVLDAPDVALRLGRLHGARSTQLLVVDGLRFDLGLRMHDQLRALVGGRAILAERLLLWAALPSTTSVQLSLVGRGPSGLRELDQGPSGDFGVARGRNATTIRRLRTGHREIHKLDVVEARFGEPGGPLAERFGAVAVETAEAVANHILHLQERTLLMVLGDHGFVLDATPEGTSALRQGGASPEEVLVPAFAWLVGETH